MKKQNVYTVKDEIFTDTLEIIYKNFNEIPYAIVGGGAIQIYASFAAMKDANLNSVNDLNGLSLSLRKTGDIDISFDYDSTELIKKLNFIIEQAAGIYTFHSFPKRFVIQAGTRRLNLNYQNNPDDLKGISTYYNDIIHTAITIEFPYKNEKIYLKIGRPEYLIVSKLTRNKPKDQVDIVLLLKSMEMDDYPFDSEEVRSILKSVNKEDKYNILLELMDSV